MQQILEDLCAVISRHLSASSQARDVKQQGVFYAYRVDVDGGRKFSGRQHFLQGGDHGVEVVVVRRARDHVHAVPVGVLDGLRVELQRRLFDVIGFWCRGRAPKKRSRPSRARGDEITQRESEMQSKGVTTEGWVRAAENRVRSAFNTYGDRSGRYVSRTCSVRRKDAERVYYTGKNYGELDSTAYAVIACRRCRHTHLTNAIPRHESAMRMALKEAKTVAVYLTWP